jgi:hypothetical protein
MPEDRSLQEKRYELLRTELKIWEREYVDRNGTKPTRGEIAANVAIGELCTELWELYPILTFSKAVKYKEYEKIRALLSGEVPPHTKDRTRKRKEPVAPTTPSKRITKANSTPTHQKLQDGPDNLAVETTPQQPKPLMLGPTPQKNGIFVGIFDQLSTQTPQSERTALTEVNINVPATPSKTSPPDYERSKFTRTPMSEGRRFLLDQFITPRKRKRQHEEQERTPSSIAKRFMTPAFFKQYAEPLEAVAEEEMPMPKDLPGKRPPFLKTLSSMIKELRHAEQDRLDDDLQLLNELEADQTYKSVQADNPSKPSCIVVENRGDLDKDGFIESDVQADLQEVNEAEAAEAQKSGMFRKLWKKKGQKRQTRRVKSEWRPILSLLFLLTIDYSAPNKK